MATRCCAPSNRSPPERRSSRRRSPSGSRRTLRRPTPAPQAFPELTERKHEVVELLARGHRNRRPARRQPQEQRVDTSAPSTLCSPSAPGRAIASGGFNNGDSPVACDRHLRHRPLARPRACRHNPCLPQRGPGAERESARENRTAQQLARPLPTARPASCLPRGPVTCRARRRRRSGGS